MRTALAKLIAAIVALAAAIQRAADRISHTAPVPHGPPAFIRIGVRVPQPQETGMPPSDPNVVTIVRDDDPPLVFDFQIVDTKGNPVPLVGAAVPGISDPTLGACTLGDDNASLVFTQSGKLGDCQVSVQADGITGTANVRVIAGAAASIVMTPRVAAPPAAAAPTAPAAATP